VTPVHLAANSLTVLKKKNKEKCKQNARTVTSATKDEDWKEEIFQKIHDLEIACQTSEARSKKIAAENDALNKEVGRLRHIEQVRNISSTPTPQQASPFQNHPEYTTSIQRNCYNCGLPGHLARACPHHRYRREERATQSSDTQSSPFRISGTSVNENPPGKYSSYLSARVGNHLCECLLDTGSEISLIPSSLVNDSCIVKTSHLLKAANGTPIDVLGQVMLDLQIESFHTVVTGLVSDHIAEVMLGIDWMVQNDIIWEFKRSRIFAGGNYYPLHKRADRNRWCRRVILQEDSVIPPRSEANIAMKVVFRRVPTSLDDEQWGTEPNYVTPGIHVSRTLVPRDKWTNVPVRVMNVSTQPISLKSGIPVANLWPVEVVDQIDNQHSTYTQKKELCNEDEAFIEKMMHRVDGSLPESGSLALCEILKDHIDVFSKSENDLGRTDIITHRIEAGNAKPVRQQLQRYPPAHIEAISQHVDNMLEQGIIEPAFSPWASNVVLVRKKDGSLRCCIDYRKLNAVTRKDAYPLPRIDSCLDAMSSAKWFSTFDLRSSYHQVVVNPQDRDKTAFICPRGMYRYKNMPFGLCNAGATFQRLMDVVMSGLHLDVCLVYLDDIIVFSPDIATHLERIVRVLDGLHSAGLKLKPEKCTLFQRCFFFRSHCVWGWHCYRS